MLATSLTISEYPNTILLLSGDHGPRDTPNLNEIEEIGSVKLDKRCKLVNYGGESLYVASGVLSYFGTHPVILNLFKELQNKVYTGTSDH